MASQEPQFSLQPVVMPDDYAAILDVGARAFSTDEMSNALFPRNSDGSMTAAQTNYRLQKMRHQFEGKTGMRAHGAKIVLETPASTNGDGPTEKPAIASCTWLAPHKRGVTELSPQELEDMEAAELKHLEEEDPSRRAKVAEGSAATSRFLKRLDEYADELLGKDRCYCFWYLSSLVTVPEWQRNGLGLRLVKWGLELAELEAKKGAEADANGVAGDRVKGAYVVATPAGLRTYLKAGMEEIGREAFDYGDGQSVTHVWLAKIFHE